MRKVEAGGRSLLNANVGKVDAKQMFERGLGVDVDKELEVVTLRVRSDDV